MNKDMLLCVLLEMIRSCVCTKWLFLHGGSYDTVSNNEGYRYNSTNLQCHSGGCRRISIVFTETPFQNVSFKSDAG